MSILSYPHAQIAEDTWEIDEFGCASLFVLVGAEKALVMDTGIGIGDLQGFIWEKITPKPCIVVATHGHPDHVGGMGGFGEYYLNEKDFFFPEEVPLEERRAYAARMAQYQPEPAPYDPERHIQPWSLKPKRLPLQPGMMFDLGNRVVQSYSCSGHTPGQTAFLDRQSRILFCGDELNCDPDEYRAAPGAMLESAQISRAEAALGDLIQLAALGDAYDSIYDSHHDYRALGEPLEAGTLSDAILQYEALLHK